MKHCCDKRRKRRTYYLKDASGRIVAIRKVCQACGRSRLQEVPYYGGFWGG